MHNNKSKAFIITFIVVILLLLAGYFFFFKGKGTTEGTLANKVFAPLLGSSKQKDVTPINTGDTTTTDTNDVAVDGDNSINNGGEVVNNGTGKEVIVPKLNSIAGPSTICRDKNGKVVTCATNAFTNIDTNTTQTGKTTDKTDLSPAEQCPDGNPVTFTTEEQKNLDALLADYYRIAGKLKTESDIYTLNDAGVEYTDLIAQAISLTNDCEEEKADPAYTGPQEVKDNPYYQNPNSTGMESYLADETEDPLRKLIENAIARTPQTTLADPILVGDPAYNNLDTFFFKNYDFENLFGIW